MAEIVWTSDLELGIEEIDAQHKIFINIVNSLRRGIEEKDLDIWLEPLLDQLRGYAHYHFGTEELYFRLYGFEGAAEHIAEHKKMMGRIAQIIERHESSGIDITQELPAFLDDWLDRHIPDFDRRYVACFKEHGLR
jgi:hemerythrin